MSNFDPARDRFKAAISGVAPEPLPLRHEIGEQIKPLRFAHTAAAWYDPN
jgi:hypothetical protein